MTAPNKYERESEDQYLSLLCEENAHYLCFEGCDCKCHKNPEAADAIED